MQKYNVIGVMSGTSLDGLDIAHCEFNLENNEAYNYQIINAKTFKYKDEWKNILRYAHDFSALELVKTNIEYGKYIGEIINQFVNEYSIDKQNIDFISSHGHTVFHKPEEGYTLQIGHGGAISAISNINVISDFRSMDVALGGEGAPLVPIGDYFLFNNYDFCLNIGGIANISFKQKDSEMKAFDICAANIILNYLANQIDLEYDNNGKIASKGTLSVELFNILNDNSFYAKKAPKSLGREWIEANVLNILNNFDIPIEDKLNTCVNHIAFQISKIIKNNFTNGIVTGGGTYNDFLISLIKKYSGTNIHIPNNYTIDFKEALIFAFLGVLWSENKINCLSSVTGAKKDNIGGALYKSH